MQDPLERFDYYELLGVSESASNDEIRAAFHRFALLHHPDRHASEPDDRREHAARIYRRGAEGYRVLCDPVLRRAYDEQRARGKRRFDPEQARSAAGAERVAVAGPPIRNARARPFAQKASEAMSKGEWANARLNLQLALQHEPGHPLLQAHLAEVERRIAHEK